METITIIDDEDCTDEFNYEVNKAKYYARLETEWTEDDSVCPQTVNELAMIIKIIKFGSDMNRNRTKYMEVMDVIQENGKDVLISKRLNPYIDPILEVVPVQTSFDAIAEAHLALNHAVGKGFISTLLKRYNIPQIWIEIFLDVCNICSKVKNVDITNKNTSYVLDDVFETQIVDSSALIVEWSIYRMPDDNGFQYVFCYMDLVSYYLILKPLKTTSTEEITLQLINIFADFGIPNYYHCDKSPVWLAGFDIDLAAKTITSMLSKDFPKPLPSTYTQKYFGQVLKHSIRLMLRQLTNWPITIKNLQWRFNVTATEHYLKEKPYKAHFARLPNNMPKVAFNNKDEKEKSETKDNCVVCHKQIFKKYQCLLCRKFCHINCCDAFKVKGKILQLHYKCIRCCKTEV